MYGVFENQVTGIRLSLALALLGDCTLGSASPAPPYETHRQDQESHRQHHPRNVGEVDHRVGLSRLRRCTGFSEIASAFLQASHKVSKFAVSLLARSFALRIQLAPVATEAVRSCREYELRSLGH